MLTSCSSLSFLQTLPWAPLPCRPPAVRVAAWFRATPTPRPPSASFGCRNSFGSTWSPPTTWCTTRPTTWARSPLCPTWAWTSTCRPRWAPCPASPITSRCHRPSRCGTARWCSRRPAASRGASREASTARPRALRTSAWGLSSTQPRWDWTRSPTEAQAAQFLRWAFALFRSYEFWALSTGSHSGSPTLPSWPLITISNHVYQSKNT